MVGFLSLRLLLAFKKGSIGPAWPDILDRSSIGRGSVVDRLWIAPGWSGPPRTLSRKSVLLSCLKNNRESDSGVISLQICVEILLIIGPRSHFAVKVRYRDFAGPAHVFFTFRRLGEAQITQERHLFTCLGKHLLTSTPDYGFCTICVVSGLCCGSPFGTPARPTATPNHVLGDLDDQVAPMSATWRLKSPKLSKKA